MAAFGPLLRSYRLRAGLGLRTFAGLIDERASTVSAIESLRRGPWLHEGRLHRVADVLGFAESCEAWRELTELARHCPERNGAERSLEKSKQTLQWWWTAENAPSIDPDVANELANFIGAIVDPSQQANGADFKLPALTELAIEWRVRRLLGRRNSHVAAGPVDVEAALEDQGNIRLEILPGLVPRFSVQACVANSAKGLTIFVDRIVADSRPLATYRQLLAQCYAPTALWSDNCEMIPGADWFEHLRASNLWPTALRDCERFALAMLLPARLVLTGTEEAYRELVEQQGWVDSEEGARAVRNRLAEQFAVPPALMHRRLVGWPCHLYGRIAQALAAQEPTLPPTDWLVDDDAPRQRTLFDLGELQHT